MTPIALDLGAAPARPGGPRGARSGGAPARPASAAPNAGMRRRETALCVALSAALHLAVLAAVAMVASRGEPSGGSAGAMAVTLVGSDAALAALTEAFAPPDDVARPEAAESLDPIASPDLVEPPEPALAPPLPSSAPPAPSPPDPVTPPPPAEPALAPPLPSSAPPAPSPPDPVTPPAEAALAPPLPSSAPPAPSPPDPVTPPPPAEAALAPPLPASSPREAAAPLAIIGGPGPRPRPADLQPTARATAAAPARLAPPAEARQTARAAGTGGARAAGPQGSAEVTTGAAQAQVGARMIWGAQIQLALQRGIPFPRGMERATRDARLVFALSVTPDGWLRGAEVLRSSGDPGLDADVLRSLRGIGRLPRAPGGLTDPTYAFTAPIEFRAP